MKKQPSFFVHLQEFKVKLEESLREEKEKAERERKKREELELEMRGSFKKELESAIRLETKNAVEQVRINKEKCIYYSIILLIEGV